MAALCLLAVRTQAAQETTTYTYDGAGRLAAAYTSSGGTNSASLYQYDLAGNIVRCDAYAPAETDDLDGDSLNDALELQYFHDLDETPGSDPDSDGLVNSNEFASAGDPTRVDTDGDGQGDWDEYVAGTALDDETEYFYVTNLIVVAGGQVRIMCDTKAGRTYQLQKCADATQPWVDEGSSYDASSSGPYYFDIAVETNASFRIGVHVTP